MLVLLTSASVPLAGCAAFQKAGADFVQAEKDGWDDLKCQRTPGCAPPARVPRANRGPVRPYENPPPRPDYGPDSRR